MLTYDLDARGELTLYEALYRRIREDILAGRLEAGERLPSKRSLAQHLKVSVITVENAYAQLVAEGYLRPEARRGYFVVRLETRPEPARPGTAPPEKRPDGEPEDRAEEDELLDLRGNQVDPARFPFATWSKLMRQVLSEQDKRLLLPIPNQGVPELQSAIAGHLRSFRGLDVAPGQIVVGAGTEYLYQLLIQLLGTGGAVAVEDPGYPKLRRIYEKGGVDCRPVPLDDQGLSIADLVASGASVAHISPSHHYPTGSVTPIARRYELLHWAGRDRTILEDDYDSEFRFDRQPVAPLQSIDEHGRVVYLNTFSQTIAPSMRISYMVLPPRLLEQYRRELGFYACTVPSFEQYTLAKFISGGWYEKHLSRMRNYYRQQRARVLEAFRNSPFAGRISITERGAGLHFLLRLDTEESDESLRRRGLEAGVRLSFLSEYAAVPHPDHAHTLVVNYSGLDDARLPEAVAALAALLG